MTLNALSPDWFSGFRLLKCTDSDVMFYRLFSWGCRNILIKKTQIKWGKTTFASYPTPSHRGDQPETRRYGLKFNKIGIDHNTFI
jgi:hypothetical protein